MLDADGTRAVFVVARSGGPVSPAIRAAARRFQERAFEGGLSTYERAECEVCARRLWAAAAALELTVHTTRSTRSA